MKLKQTYVMVYCDTTSNLVGELIALKKYIELGLRSFNKDMQEEKNRIFAEHVSTYLYCFTKIAINNS